MNSKYLHLIALIVAVFFAGIFMRGERARKKQIKRELSAIEQRQDEINAIVADIVRVTAEKDSLLKLQIALAKEEVSKLNREEALPRNRIDSLGQEIDRVNALLASLGQAINDVPDFIIDADSMHAVGLDPDITAADSIAFNPIRTFVGRPLLAVTPTPATTADASRGPAFLGVARMFAERGVQEVPPGSNRGPDVEKFLAAVDLFPSKDRFGKWHSFPYCAAFVSYCLDEAGDVALPLVRSAGARKFITRNSIESRIVLRGGTRIEPGTLVIWARNARDPRDPSGHIGFVIDWEGQAGTTVEANTTSGKQGSQREGDGVYFRKRMLSPGSAFRITHFTPVRLK
ncbi:MAG: CHAP domain-containing protein [Bacteroidota bacterium]